MLEIRCCLDKFSSIIFQSNRLNNHQKVLLTNVVNFLDNEKKDLMMAINNVRKHVPNLKLFFCTPGRHKIDLPCL